MTKHEALLADYVDELSTAKTDVETWWNDLLAAEQRLDGDRVAAKIRLAQRWPDGPASHPLVLRVIRKYWLACEALNEAAAGGDALEDAPEEEHDFDPELTETDDASGMTAERTADTPPDLDDDDDDDGADDHDEVYPHVFIHEWLAGDHEELFQFLMSLSYWPVGLDSNGRYT